MSESAQHTRRLGRALGAALRSGDVVALTGALGAGKTHFVKGLAEGLEVDPDEQVVSPTFVLMRKLSGRLTLYHLDAYRVLDVAELVDLGLDEMRHEPAAVVVIEWADRVPQAIPPEALRVTLEHQGPQQRGITIRIDDAGRRQECERRLRSIAAP